jgi:hypothetical protein
LIKAAVQHQQSIDEQYLTNEKYQEKHILLDLYNRLQHK